MQHYKISEARNVRNTLLALGSVRLARRSQEMLSMTLREVIHAELNVLDNERLYIINVARHKNRKHSTDALVTFTESEFKVLNLYNRKLRKMFTTDDCENAPVFTVANYCKNSQAEVLKGQPAAPMNYSSTFKILSKFKITSGKCFLLRE